MLFFWSKWWWIRMNEWMKNCCNTLFLTRIGDCEVSVVHAFALQETVEELYKSPVSPQFHSFQCTGDKMKEFYFRDNWGITGHHVICCKLVLKCYFQTFSQFLLSVSFATNPFHLPVLDWHFGFSQVHRLIFQKGRECVYQQGLAYQFLIP